MTQASLLTTLLLAAAAGLGQSPTAGSAASTSAGSFLKGNAAAGKAIFDGSGNCLSCHRIGAMGSVVGPNLSNIGSRVSPDALEQALLNPPAQAEPQDRLYEVVTRSGKTVRGKLLNQDPFSLQMLDSDGQLVAFSRSEIREGRFVDPPPMPSYQGKLTSTQMDDLVAYLVSLRLPENR